MSEKLKEKLLEIVKNVRNNTDVENSMNSLYNITDACIKDLDEKHHLLGLVNMNKEALLNNYSNFSFENFADYMRILNSRLLNLGEIEPD